ncbi:hypothetical protein KBZ15_05095 [Cyanobium sp. BA20m-p-22]|uniref:hypothetical protein n=1 Tax=Cyanobium sp. BA20m-p-22 TaxID=2823704 RepID=UPI0020CD2ACE|nr:hypothetical protein [Cyanobium sp. BA20m-p-22]MCP9909292.1 hypothetical protein [Cyanobium sp. BA20m-p-22]
MAVLLAVVLWTSALEGGVDLSTFYAVGAFVASTIRPPIDESVANYGTTITKLAGSSPIQTRSMHLVNRIGTFDLVAHEGHLANMC